MSRQIPVLLAFTVAASAFTFAANGKPPANSSIGVRVTVFLPESSRRSWRSDAHRSEGR